MWQRSKGELKNNRMCSPFCSLLLLLEVEGAPAGGVLIDLEIVGYDSKMLRGLVVAVDSVGKPKTLELGWIITDKAVGGDQEFCFISGSIFLHFYNKISSVT